MYSSVFAITNTTVVTVEASKAFIVKAMYIVFLHCSFVESFITEWRVCLLFCNKDSRAVRARALKYCCLILCSVLGLKFDCAVDAIIKHPLVGLRTPFWYYRISSCRLMIAMLCTRYKLIWLSHTLIDQLPKQSNCRFSCFFFIYFLSWSFILINGKTPRCLRQNMSTKLQTF